uniref:Uncharacterized protein n=1 Tax=Aegilops tauschii TaxID=37682 RepID=R7WAU3_AEGTA
MELSSLLPSLSPRRALRLSFSTASKTPRRPRPAARAARPPSPAARTPPRKDQSPGDAVGISVAGGGGAGAVSTSRRVVRIRVPDHVLLQLFRLWHRFRSSKIPESDFITLPNGIKYAYSLLTYPELLYC